MSNNTSTTKIAIVTGGSRGIGRNTAINLAKRGIDVIFTYHSNRQEAEVTAAAIQKLGRKSSMLQLDVGDSATFDAFAGEVKQVLQSWGRDRFDYLVNNAGTGLHTPFADVSEADFDKLFNTSFKGVYFLTQKLLPLMADGGRIINLSSAMTRITVDGGSAYAAVKGAVETFTRYLAKELGPRGITVNVVAPGAIETDFGGGFVRDNADFNAMIAAETALGRAGLPDDIGPMIASLLSDDNRWVTGQRIEVSGGMSL